MDDDSEIVKGKYFEKLKSMSFEERAFRIIKNFYLWQNDMTLENMDGNGIEILRSFSEWLYEPENAETKKRILMRVEEELGIHVGDYKIPRPGNDD